MFVQDRFKYVREGNSGGREGERGIVRAERSEGGD